MKERQRWRPEEDALLRAYVKKYGPREWNLVSQRMNKVLDRDAKSSHERWKNYLKPGIKKGSLTEDEQRLVVSLQAKYGNKWKKIAAEVPGRTAKRLGKWWEVFKEKQEKQKSYTTTTSDSANHVGEGKYDHILHTFAEKHMQNQKQHFVVPINYSLPSVSVAMPPPPLSLNLPPNAIPIPDFFHMTPSASTPSTSSTVGATSSRPPWMSSLQQSASKSSVKSSYTSSESASPSSSSPSVTLSLSPSLSNQVVSNASPNNAVSEIPEAIPKENFKPNSSVDNMGSNMQISAAETNLLMHQISSFFQQCQELEERQQSWLMHKREASWRLKRLQEQMESEKARKRREKIEEIESKVWALREEEKLYLDRLEKDYREQIARLHRDEEIKEARMMEMWTSKHVQLTRFYEHMVHAKVLKP